MEKLNINIFCYASFKKNKNCSSIGWVFDEAHHLTESKVKMLFTSDKPKKILMLSATLDDEKMALVNRVAFKMNKSNKVLSVTTAKAISLGILPEPTIYKIEVDLSKDKKAFREYCTISETVDELKEEYENTGEVWRMNKWLSAASSRKSWITDYKATVANNIIRDFLEDSRYIVFGGIKIKHLESLEEAYYEKNVVSSNLTKNQNKEVIENFNSEKINSLYAVKMLREGMNLVNIHKGLIVQLDGKKLSFIQMMGRIFRSTTPKLYVIVLKHTQDENYWNNAINEEIKYVKEIKYN